MKTWYIYAHYTLDTNECFYIGVGTGKRAWNNSLNNRNEYWHNIVNKHGYTTEIIKDGFIDREVAVKKEVMLQLFFKPRACLQYGDRCTKVVNEETRSKLSKSLSNRKVPRKTVEKIANSNRGKKRSIECKQKMSIKNSKKVINCRGQIFKSAKHAEEITGAKSWNITNNIKGKRKSAGKYFDGQKIKWKYCGG